MKRPELNARYWTWKDQEQNETPGVGLFAGHFIKAHLTPAQARTLADKLHDMADKLEAGSVGTSTHQEMEQATR
ncbi:hypothetical protein [[Micrococcus luteus] ATCC 49442]|uniref:hypothetical protein n=1 Tax=[Micrococcus luteus] ATCC 49442 TaxID=2698727 RepID=UPI0013DCDA28|nr:hypothetical protein [[Micrococcus luteus] ATCC 49442]